MFLVGPHTSSAPPPPPLVAVRCAACGHDEYPRQHNALGGLLSHLGAPRVCPASVDDYHLGGWEHCGCAADLHRSS